VFDNFPEQLIRISWTKTGFAWFDQEYVEAEDKDEDLSDDDDDNDDLVLHMDWSGDTVSSDNSGEKTDTAALMTEDSGDGNSN
jgi:hypothetical protein